MFSDRKIVIFILIVVDITITAAQYDYDESESDSFEDFSLKKENPYGTKSFHASIGGIFYDKRKPGEPPALTKPNGKFECPLCYVKTLLGRCLRICYVKDILRYTDQIRQFNPNEEQEKLKEQIKILNKKRLQEKKDKESMYISVQRKILDWLMSLFRNNNPHKSKTQKAIIKWVEDLFKPKPTTPKPPNFDYVF